MKRPTQHNNDQPPKAMRGFSNAANILIMDGSAQLHPRDDYQPNWQTADGVVTPNPMKEYLSQSF